MTRIIYTVHAKERMAVRGITDQMVHEALEVPDERGIGYGSRTLAYRRFAQGRIKVVYVEEKEQIVVITVMWED
ncbi:MAG: hypothetical protein AUK02_05180 [Anaerolineae bacterium CG2_30_58_95]|nr:MAG: hypothetical protein AUK02_05180 [Anaerolineae bacterium CG2_30_58_95]